MANPTTYINPQQLGGIESYTFNDTEAFGTRAILVNTGGGLRYRLLPDRGLDIDHAFFNQHSLAFLTHRGVTKPSRAYDRGIDWLKSFPGGLLTSCGPLSVGPPANDAGEELGLHGHHSNTAATIESIVQPDPRRDQTDMSVTAVVRYGQFYNPCIELRRTVRSSLGQNFIDVLDEFTNAGNTDAPHAWLLHINFGYPLVDAGTELCFDDSRIEPRDDEDSRRHFAKGAKYKVVPPPTDNHLGSTHAFAYVLPRKEKGGGATVGIVNNKLGFGVAVRYDARQFPLVGSWQHWGPGEYVTALEPMNGSVNGRDKDRAAGIMDRLRAGETKTYRYRIEVVTDRAGMDDLRAINR
jgi:hypothetical protein